MIKTLGWAAALGNFRKVHSRIRSWLAAPCFRQRTRIRVGGGDCDPVGRNVATSRKSNRKPLLHSGLESAGESVANVVVDRQQLLTSESHRGDAHNGDQRGDQAILDGGNAGF